MVLNKKQYTIQQVSLMLEVPKTTLRFWESALEGLIDPVRTRGRQRRYNEEHLSIINKVKTMREDGKTIVKIKKQLEGGENPKSGSKENPNIDFLANKVAEFVKTEVGNYIKTALK